MKKALKIMGKVLWKLLIVGAIGFVVTFAIYMLNLENKLIYRFVYHLLQKLYDNQKGVRRVYAAVR